MTCKLTIDRNAGKVTIRQEGSFVGSERWSRVRGLLLEAGVTVPDGIGESGLELTSAKPCFSQNNHNGSLVINTDNFSGATVQSLN